MKKLDVLLNDDNMNEDDKMSKATEIGSQTSLIHVYFKELEVIKYSKQENYGIMDLIGKRLLQNVTSITIAYFKYIYYTFHLEIYDNFDFHIYVLAAFGGVVGLCVGFSFLSAAEFVYFFSIRLIFDKIKRNNTENQVQHRRPSHINP